MCCDHQKDLCVCEKVRVIADAQDAVADHCCEVSCERSIRDLLGTSPVGTADTIPFMLLCDCKNSFAGLLPYFGWGVKKKNSCFKPITSPFFRVKKFKEDTECCAVLELLYPVPCSAPSSGSHHSYYKYENFIRTGACFEVDLSKFSGITCFPPVEAIEAADVHLLQAGADAVEDMKKHMKHDG